MNKDQALTRAFELVETLDLTNLTALQVVQTVNLIAEEFLEVYAEGRDDKVREQGGWKGRESLRTTPKMPHEVLKDDQRRAAWPIRATRPEDLTAKEVEALDPTHEWYPKCAEAPTHKYTRIEERSEG